MILFLDFDGVTHPQPCYPENVFCRLPLIEDVIREFAHVQIVISSSWREHYSQEDMQEFFSPDIRSRVIGSTPTEKQLIQIGMGTGELAEWQRQWECEWWMDENHRWSEPWVAIDARPNWFSPTCENLLSTDAKTGFQPGDQPKLRNLLGRNVNAA